MESVLIVEDDLMQQKMLQTLLKRRVGFQSCAVSNGREALDLLSSGKHSAIKIVILDLNMPIMGGMETLEIIQQRFPELSVIMLTGDHDTKNVVRAMKLGATDFLTKPYDAERLSITVKNALKINTLSKEVNLLKKEREGTLGFENLVGHDHGLSHVVAIGRKAAASDIPVFIAGETGVGKEIFSQAIHGDGRRAGKPFIAINCGAIPAQLIESTLFGHEKGAFTGATEKTIGKFREADGGTIFLDEIGELPLDAQVKLLRVLQQKEVEPVGASKPVPVNVRIISATNRDLKKEVEKGNFREDLYFRLNVLEIEIPPLRERKQDIPALALHFIERFCASESIELCELSADAEQYLFKHAWSGNVRELENAINRAIVLSKNNILEIGDFSKIVEQGENTHNESSEDMEYSIFNAAGELKKLKTIEKELMQLTLKKFDYNISQAAHAIDMAKSTFYRKMNDMNIPENS